MAHCEEYTELISAALDGALSPTEQEKLEAHLSSCPECAALFRQLSALHAALEELPQVEPPADLKSRILDGVAQEQILPFAPPKKKGLSHHSQRWLATAAVLAIAIFGTWSWKPWERNDNVTNKPASIAGVSDQASVSAEGQEPAAPETVLPSRAPQEKLIAPQAEEPSPSPQAMEEAVPEAPADSSPADAPMLGRSMDADSGIVSEETEEAAPQIRMAKAPTVEATSTEEDQEPAPSPDVPDAPDTPGVRTFPALFSAPLPSDLPAENGGELPESLIVCATAPEETAEAPRLTPREALDRLLEEYPFPGCEDWEYEELEAGWRSPEWTAADGARCWLEYNGIPYGVEHSFNSYSYEEGAEEAIPLAGFSVPLDGGEITTAGA